MKSNSSASLVGECEGQTTEDPGGSAHGAISFRVFRWTFVLSCRIRGLERSRLMSPGSMAEVGPALGLLQLPIGCGFSFDEKAPLACIPGPLTEEILVCVCCGGTDSYTPVPLSWRGLDLILRLSREGGGPNSRSIDEDIADA